MSAPAVAFLLSAVIAVLIGVICYQRAAFHRGTRAKLRKMAETLEHILDTDSGERVLVFTDDRTLMALAAQIDRFLEEYQSAKAEYRRAELASKRMLSNISHDIKTPLTVILGYLEIMRLSDSPSREMLDKVEGKARQVMELIDQFFTLAKLEAGDTELTLTGLSANEVCRESILYFYELLTQKGFQVELAIPEHEVRALGDAESVRRILFNLISNAIRYGSDGGYLGLSLREGEEAVWIDVTDRGKGIAPAFAATVFDRLFTLEDSRNRDIQGNGLGLTIARDLARQMGGDVTLESEPFVRTTFSLRLKKLAPDERDS